MRNLILKNNVIIYVTPLNEKWDQLFTGQSAENVTLLDAIRNPFVQGTFKYHLYSKNLKKTDYVAV